MSLKSGDRVKETTITTGTGDVTLSGAVSGFQAFSAICADQDLVAYAIVHQTLAEWEVGVGTWTIGGVLKRTTVLASSNSGAAVNFSAGTKDVFCDFPAQHGIGAPVALVVSVDALVPAGSSLYAVGEYEVANGKALDIGVGAVLEVG
jgi:hypothetical protein